MKVIIMKKYISAIFALIIGVVLLIPAKPVEAQVIYGNRCCDGFGVARCYIPPYPMGAACYCNGIPGVGSVC